MAAIGLVRCNAQYRYEAPRQAILAAGNTATIELFDGPGVRDALTGLDGFERIWVVYEFHLERLLAALCPATSTGDGQGRLLCHPLPPSAQPHRNELRSPAVRRRPPAADFRARPA